LGGGRCVPSDVLRARGGWTHSIQACRKSVIGVRCFSLSRGRGDDR
jgi:hypothetical protein